LSITEILKKTGILYVSGTKWHRIETPLPV